MTDTKQNENLDKVLQGIANKEQAVLLGFVNSYVPKRYDPIRFGHAQIGLVEEFIVEDTLEEISKKTNIKKVFFLINSFGGGLPSSYKIAKAIRNAFNDITVFVPHIAVSGGTLLALTGDKIVMGTMSQLGGLDPQVMYKGQKVSVNSMFAAKRILDGLASRKT